MFMSKRYIATLDIVLAIEETSKEAKRELATRLARAGLTKGFAYWVVQTNFGEEELVRRLKKNVFQKLKLSKKASVTVKEHRLL